MVSVTDSSPFTSLFGPGQHDMNDYTRYPDTPRSEGASPLDLSSSLYQMPVSMSLDPPLYVEASSSSSISQYHSFSGHQPSPGFCPSDSLYGLEEGSGQDSRMPSSSLSTASAASSAMGSPQSNPSRTGNGADWTTTTTQPMGTQPSIVSTEFISPEYTGYPHPEMGMEESLSLEYAHAKGFVDPSLIHAEIGPPQLAIHYESQFQHHHALQSHPHNPHSHHHLQQQPHPQVHQPYPGSPSVASSSPMHRNDSASPSFFQSSASYQQTPFTNSPYATPIDPNARRPSMSSFLSPSSGDYHSGDESKEKQRCTYPDCGKVFKDLKAHMLTHQTERPEKCPIQTCEYHVKGFARKYDKNRHTLTHYKGTMVCGFCPGSGSPAEKSFNRADVFKRHLTAVHAVEQSPPNSRKKPPTAIAGGNKITGYAADATGKCSTCSQTFSNAQDFYEHLDDCVLRIVQQEDPGEAVNAKHLAEVENDKAVLRTLAKNKVSDADKSPAGDEVSSSDDDVDMKDETAEDEDPKVFGDQRLSSSSGSLKSRGLTHSRGGVPLKVKSKDRKPKRYPTSWGDNTPKAANMKKRVMACFDGPRRLAKDDMLLCVDHELRLKLSDGKHYVTDLDVQTLKRAEGFLNATDEEKGPWVSDDPTEDQVKQMQEIRDMLAPIS